MIEQLKASAGSGKTFALTRRVASLILGATAQSEPAACGRRPGDGYDASEILAITFTNKAAAEMRERALSALKELALSTPRDQEGVRRRAKAVRELERILLHARVLNIRTIDSLLNRVARLFALEMGLSPDFETIFAQAEYFDPLYDRFSAELDESGPARRALFEQAVSSMLHVERVPGFWIRNALKERLFTVFAHLLEHPDDAPDAAPEDILAMAERDLGALRLAAEAVAAGIESSGAEPVANFTAFLAKIARVEGFGPLPDSTYGRKECLADCLKKASRDRIGPAEEADYAALRSLYARCGNNLPVLKSAASFLPFAALAREFAELFERQARERGFLPASLCPARVRELLSLGGAPDAWCRMGARLFHLLIDEFQDTSIAQWEALEILAEECLAKGGSLFYVGDVKQAIYGWRGGEAELFDAAPERSGLTRQAPLRRNELPCNWRSAKDVVAFNNAFFTALGGPAAPAVAEAMLPGAPESRRRDFADRIRTVFAGAAQDLPKGRPPKAGTVVLHPLPGDDAGERDENVREELVRLLSEDVIPRRGPGAAAILTRSNPQAAQVSSWLIEAGIPVVTENSLLLADHPLIAQLAAFLAFLDYPPDNQSFWRFVSGRELFGEAAGLSRETLLDWLCGVAGGRPLYAAFREDFPEVWTRLIRPFVRQAGLTSPYDLAFEILCAYKTFVRRPGDEPFLRRFLEICHLAEKNGHISLAAFADFWRAQGAGEKAPQPENLDAVRVMTIHKSKGLEFPVVILPFLHFHTGPAEGLEAIALDGKTALVPLRKELDESYWRALANSRLEQLDVLYVAFTRAELELFAFVPQNRKLVEKNPVLRAVGAIFESMGRPIGEEPIVFGAVPAPLERAAAETPPDAAPVCAPCRAPLPSPESGEEAGAIPPPLAWIPRLKVYRNAVRDLRQSLTFTEKKRGVLAHAAAERFQALLADGRELSGARDCALEAALLDAPPDESLRETLRRDLAAMLDWLAAQPGFEEYLRKGLAERDILDARAEKRRPDLLVRLPERTVIIDYKTGAASEEHAAQVRRYLALAGALPGAPREAVGYLAYLDQRTLREVRPEAS